MDILIREATVIFASLFSRSQLLKQLQEHINSIKIDPSFKSLIIQCSKHAGKDYIIRARALISMDYYSIAILTITHPIRAILTFTGSDHKQDPINRFHSQPFEQLQDPVIAILTFTGSNHSHSSINRIHALPF